MDFKFSPEQEMFRKVAREFAEKEVAPWVGKMEESGETPPEIIAALARYDFLGITIPQEYGGLGLGHIARMIALEEIGRISSATAMMLQVFQLGIEPFVRFGSVAQKEQYLPILAKGNKLASAAVTESTGGSDPTGVRTEAQKDGDSYVLNGRKVFITNAHLANVVVILAKNAENPKQFSALIVEKGTQGFRAGRVEHKVGMKGCDTGEIILENCRVPAGNLIGKEGDGLKVVLGAIGDVGRAGMVGCALGLQQACLEASVKFAQERILYEKPISKLQAIQWKIADIYMDLQAGRLLGYYAASKKDLGERCDVDFATAKYFTTEAASRAAKMAVDIHGGYGVMTEFPVQRYLRDAAVLGPSAGTSDIMKVIMARAALG